MCNLSVFEVYFCFFVLFIDCETTILLHYNLFNESCDPLTLKGFLWNIVLISANSSHFFSWSLFNKWILDCWWKWSFSKSRISWYLSSSSWSRPVISHLWSELSYRKMDSMKWPHCDSLMLRTIFVSNLLWCSLAWVTSSLAMNLFDRKIWYNKTWSTLMVFTILSTFFSAWACVCSSLFVLFHREALFFLLLPLFNWFLKFSVLHIHFFFCIDICIFFLFFVKGIQKGISFCLLL